MMNGLFQVGGGPGAMSPDRSLRDWSSKYAFLDDLQALRESVKGPAATDRLQYWLHTFRCEVQIDFIDMYSLLDIHV